MSETGVVKFGCEHHAVPLRLFAGFDALNACRRELLRVGLIGVDREGIAFGNLSVRDAGAPHFYITGSGTSALERVGLEHLAKVTAYDFDRNWLRCEGGTVASSESLTHAAIYEAEPDAMAVIHCHSAHLWERLLETSPATAREVEYGTPEMAREVHRLFAKTDVKERGIFAMAGHQSGVVAFGGSLDEALRRLQRKAPAQQSQGRG